MLFPAVRPWVGARERRGSPDTVVKARISEANGQRSVDAFIVRMRRRK